MSQTQPDLREALAMVRALEVIDALPPAYKPSDDTPLRGSLPGVWPTIGDLREFVDQVSALQAEVEAARALNRDLHRRTQKAESFRARHANTYGVEARWAGRQALRKALAEVERLQKVEGEREKGRVPDGTGHSPDGQTASRSDPSDFDPSRGPTVTTAQIAEMDALSAAASPGIWGVWEEHVEDEDAAKRELSLLVDDSPKPAGNLFMLNAAGRCPATTGCGPTSRANADFIAALVNGYRSGHLRPAQAVSASGEYPSRKHSAVKAIFVAQFYSREEGEKMWADLSKREPWFGVKLASAGRAVELLAEEGIL